MLTFQKMAWKIYFILVFIPIIFHCVIGDQDFTDLCPERTENPVRHTCQKACTKDQVCPKKRLKCLCDGECGMSCVAPRSSCLWPVTLENANISLKQETWNFGDQILVRCQPGFKMANGQEVAQSRCQGDKKWSVTAPCDAVSTCNEPPSIENGYFVKNGHLIEGALVEYTCNPGYRLEGSAFTECLGNKTWSIYAPTCRKVYCPPPPEIKEGILVAVKKAEYEVSEVIYYMCKRNFFMDGSHSVTCMENGQWSDGPACRARCKVPVQRSQVIYQGRKVWVTEIDEGLVHHSENVNFFCRNKTHACSFTASSQCFDGVLKPPECYEEPTWVQYTFFSKNLVSEISSCQEL
ncbi:beta-2-glycoprotein 1-like isoform X1 [Bufo gargarizans]|uniref:beta-2-glycoprotein 1-like isoform X1 n=1 Tax=Bufo gargarizans TaxID=30331 RepID=UPI001CF199BE|nr:beta-2-glycoprotein 1-like isoform X1 [Bufo gargarizans]